jgi:hypothetical protein
MKPKSAVITGATEGYYKITYVTGSVTVNPLDVIVTVTGDTVNATYDGQQHTAAESLVLKGFDGIVQILEHAAVDLLLGIVRTGQDLLFVIDDAVGNRAVGVGHTVQAGDLDDIHEGDLGREAFAERFDVHGLGHQTLVDIFEHAFAPATGGDVVQVVLGETAVGSARVTGENVARQVLDDLIAVGTIFAGTHLVGGTDILGHLGERTADGQTVVLHMLFISLLGIGVPVQEIPGAGDRRECNGQSEEIEYLTCFHNVPVIRR